MTHSLTLFGCGRMGSALASGWLKAENPPAISIHDPNPGDLLQDWANAGRVALNAAPQPADVLIIAVKPQVFPKVLDEIKAYIGPGTLIVSIMAGVTMDGLADKPGTGRIARAMPNTPGAVGEGVTLIATNSSLSAADISLITKLLSPLGTVEGPMSERDLQIAMTISGCGPAYAFHLVEAMAEAGIAQGLDADLSMRIARQTVIGAGALMQSSSDSAEALRVGVTSPGGVTAAALEVLMREPGFTSLMKEAVVNALKRDDELSG